MMKMILKEYRMKQKKCFILMEFLGIVCPIILPGVFSLWFDLMDGILQAVVFAYLTTSYIGEDLPAEGYVYNRIRHDYPPFSE